VSIPGRILLTLDRTHLAMIAGPHALFFYPLDTQQRTVLSRAPTTTHLLYIFLLKENARQLEGLLTDMHAGLSSICVA